MKQLASTLLLAFLMTGIVSCSQSLDEMTTNQNTCVIETKSVAPVYSNHEPYSFEEIDNVDTWKTYVSLEEKCSICQIPEEILDEMTTEALLKTCMNHPLSLIHACYENPLNAIDYLVNNSNVFNRFINREDAADCLVSLYAKMSVNKDTGQLHDETDGYVPRLFSYQLLELLLSSGLVPDTFEENRKMELEQQVKSHLEMERRNPDIFGYFSKKYCYLLKEVLMQKGSVDFEKAKEIYDGLDEKYLPLECVTKDFMDTYYYDYLYTPYGRPTLCYVYAPLSTEEYNGFMAVAAQHPGIQVVGLPTSEYNCHCYAWSMTRDDAIRLWLPSYTNYIYYDGYVPCSASDVEILVYNGGDHSAVMTSSGKVISKWHAGVLAIHDIADCPFVASNFEYYKTRTALMNSYISGSDFVECGHSYNYSLTPLIGASYLSYVWDIEEYHGWNNAYSISSTGSTSASITYAYPSEYILTVEAYLGSTLVGSSTMNINGYE